MSTKQEVDPTQPTKTQQQIENVAGKLVERVVGLETPAGSDSNQGANLVVQDLAPNERATRIAAHDDSYSLVRPENGAGDTILREVTTSPGAGKEQATIEVSRRPNTRPDEPYGVTGVKEHLTALPGGGDSVDLTGTKILTDSEIRASAARVLGEARGQIADSEINTQGTPETKTPNN